MWIQPVVSIAGLIAIAAWVVKFLSHYTAKSKELRELDAEVNATLRAALTDQKQARADEKAALEARLQRFDNEVREAEAKLASTASDLRRAARMSAVAQFGVEFLTSVHREDPKLRQGRTSQQLVRALNAIRELVAANAPAPQSQDELRARFLTAAEPVMDVYEAFLYADIGWQERSKYARRLLDDARAFPDMPMPELFARLSNLINEEQAEAEARAGGRSIEAAKSHLLEGA